MDIELARFNMVEQQIRPSEISDHKVLELLSSIKREEFVLDNYRDLAFADLRLPLIEGGKALFPRIEAKLVHELELSPTDKVLQIGASNGYVTALMAKMAKSIYVVDNSLANLAWVDLALKKQSIFNVELNEQDINQLHFADDSFNKIVILGTLATNPGALLPSLKRGGKLLGFSGRSPLVSLIKINKGNVGEITKQILLETDVDYLGNKTTTTFKL